MLVLFATGVTLAAVLASSTAAALVAALRAALGARRRARLRAEELLLLGAAAQRWLATPAAWGGPADGFRGASFDAIGQTALPLRPDVRRTPNGRYRLIPVPPCPSLDRAAARTGLDAGRDGLLVIGWDERTGAAEAVIVLSPLVQVPLARVPWAWIATLAWPDDERPAEALGPAEPTPARGPERPAPAADREAARSPLRLVHWADPPARTDRAPPRRGALWRRAA